MTSRYRTLPQVKFKEFRLLERRRVEASDTVWALLVRSKLAVETLAAAPNQHALLADEYPNLLHAQRMNQRLDRAGILLSNAESEVCTMALNFTFGLHEDFVRSCLRLLIPLGKATNGDARANSDEMHERFSISTGHAMDPDALALFSPHTQDSQRPHSCCRTGSTGPGDSPRIPDDHPTRHLVHTHRPDFPRTRRRGLGCAGVPGLIGALAVQKRLAYDVNLGLQKQYPARSGRT